VENHLIIHRFISLWILWIFLYFSSFSLAPLCSTKTLTFSENFWQFWAYRTSAEYPLPLGHPLSNYHIVTQMPLSFPCDCLRFFLESLWSIPNGYMIMIISSINIFWLFSFSSSFHSTCCWLSKSSKSHLPAKNCKAYTFFFKYYIHIY